MKGRTTPRDLLPLDLSTGFYISSVPESINAYAVNCYPHTVQSRGEEGFSLRQTPNMESVTVINNEGESRGMFKALDKLYVVKGASLYSISLDLSVQFIGPVTGKGPVDFSFNGYVLVILVPSTTAYFYTLPSVDSSGLVEIDDTNFNSYKPTLRSVTFKDGYFVYATSTLFFNGSSVTVNNGRDFTALQFESAEFKPDENVLILNFRNELYVFGTETIEVFDSSEDTDPNSFPFTRTTGGNYNLGIQGFRNVIVSGDSYFFLGRRVNENYAMYMGNGVNITKISHSGIDYFIRFLTEEEYADVTSFAYMEEGVLFVGWNFPTFTLVYDVTNSTLTGRVIWHMRAETFVDINNSTRYPVETVIKFGDINICLLYNQKFLASLSREIFENYYIQDVQFASKWYNLRQFNNMVTNIEFYCDGKVDDFSILSGGYFVNEPFNGRTVPYVNGRYQATRVGNYDIQTQYGFSYSSIYINNIIFGYITVS